MGRNAGGERGLRVLLVGINYRPERTGIAPYTAGLAGGLTARGHQVRVITTFPHYPQWQVAEGYTGLGLDDRVDGIAVRRVKHYVPSRPVGARRALSEVTFGARAVIEPWGRPDVVVAVSPALISSAMTMARTRWGRHRPAFGLIVQDLYTAGLTEIDAGGGGVAAALRGLESWTARNVDGVSVIHDRFKARVVREMGVREDAVSVIRNWTYVPDVPAFDRSEVRRRLGWEGKTVVLHAGAMGTKSGLHAAVDAARVAEQRGSKMHLVLMGDGGQRPALERQAEGLGRIEFMDPKPDQEFGQILRSADVLLVHDKPGVVEMSVPSKMTAYFSTGVPVLAATDPRSTTAEELTAAGAGPVIRSGEPDALVDAVEELVADEAKAREIGARGPVYCADVLSESAGFDAYDTWVRELAARAGRRRAR